MITIVFYRFVMGIIGTFVLGVIFGYEIGSGNYFRINDDDDYYEEEED